MIRRIFVFAVVLLCASEVSSQSEVKNFSRQISILFENDFLALRGTDGYYTNGSAINFSRLSRPKREKVIKSINSYEIGQRIYTPGRRELYVLRELDRPITGYLYGKASFNRFLNQNRMYTFGASVGTIGPNSFAREILDVIHPIGKINSEYWEWIFDYELKNEIGINLHGSYAFSLLKGKNAAMVQVTPVSNGTIGTLFTNFSQSVLIQFGKHNGMSEGTLWNSRLQGTAGETNTEMFLYLKPEVIVDMYNATVQGGLFSKSKDAITAKTNSLRFNQTIGAMFAKRRYSVGFSYTYTDKEAKSQSDNHRYGSINLAYRFR